MTWWNVFVLGFSFVSFVCFVVTNSEETNKPRKTTHENESYRKARSMTWWNAFVLGFSFVSFVCFVVTTRKRVVPESTVYDMVERLFLAFLSSQLSSLENRSLANAKRGDYTAGDTKTWPRSWVS
jgi:hypothetical protein